MWRWEFWPAWAFYPPVVAYIVAKSVRRGGFAGFSSITAANLGIPHGGFVGESKSQILHSLHSPHVLPAFLIEPGPAKERITRLQEHVERSGWSYPIILKPDVGQRGDGVKLARSHDDAAAYLASRRASVVAQVYHPGPFEAGIFYYRLPGQEHGHIFSITDKRFAEVEGDGKSTVEALILSHPRYRMQAKVFFSRHADRLNEVLSAGARLRLTEAGNHCQGTLFKDGSHLITPALEEAIDTVARSFADFYFGRFDVRYGDVEGFRHGEDFGIVELNGVTSESTNLYDPDFSLLQAYRILWRQWGLLFQIADENIKRGVRPSSWRELLRAIRIYYRRREAPVVSD